MYSPPRRGNSDDKAHPPIHPLKLTDQFNNNDEKRLFEYITRHFLACVSKNAIGDQVIVTAKIASELFTANGTSVKELNFYEVYIYRKWNSFTIPVYEEGQKFLPGVLEMVESKTIPPQLLTEQKLISLMDENGIGTDATIAQHIAKIQERDYTIKNLQHFFEPTNLGISLIEALEETKNERLINLSRPYVRANMERSIAMIANGEMSREIFVRDCVQNTKELFILFTTFAETIVQTVAKYFAPGMIPGVNQPATIVDKFSLCGKCSRLMELHEIIPNHKYNLVCKNCEINLPIHIKGDLKTKRPMFLCPICKFQVLLVKKKNIPGPNRSRRTLNSFYDLCPFCFNFPPNQNPNQNGPSAPNNDVSNKMPCFKCTYKDCALSNKSTPVKKCLCGSFMASKKIKDGCYALSCQNYPTCKNTFWMNAVKNLTVLDKECPRCKAGNKFCKIMRFEFKIGLVQSFVPIFYEGCVLCDPMLVETFLEQQVKRKRPSGSSNNSWDSGGNSGKRWNSGEGGNRRGSSFGGGNSVRNRGRGGNRGRRGRRGRGNSARGRGYGGNRGGKRGGNIGGNIGGYNGTNSLNKGLCMNCQMFGHLAGSCPKKSFKK